ncbi:MAG: PHB depolymerase family esterase [Acidobacteriota bacterium]
MLLLFLSAFLARGGQPPATAGLLAGEIEAPGGAKLPYLVYVPRDYDAARRWPLVLFLHGQGESGTDGWRQLLQGLPPALFAAPERWPAIVLLPQKPDSDREWESYEKALLALVDRARRTWAIDPERVILTGLSQGGHGSWVLGARHPDVWAAVGPVCGYAAARRRDAAGRIPADAFGGTAADLAKPLASTPVWAFHGAIDDVVPVAETEAMIAALRAAGGTPRVTIVPKVGHGVWSRAYEDPEFAAWLIAQRRSVRRPKSREPRPLSLLGQPRSGRRGNRRGPLTDAERRRRR